MTPTRSCRLRHQMPCVPGLKFPIGGACDRKRGKSLAGACREAAEIASPSLPSCAPARRADSARFASMFSLYSCKLCSSFPPRAIFFFLLVARARFSNSFSQKQSDLQ